VVGLGVFLLILTHAVDVGVMSLNIGGILFYDRFEIPPFFEDGVVLGSAGLMVLMDELVELSDQEFDFLSRFVIDLGIALHF
jgi:hypothetical protein